MREVNEADMDTDLPTTKQIIRGEVAYTLRDLADDVKAYVEDMVSHMDKEIEPDEVYKSSLLLVMMSSEAKPKELIMKCFKSRKEFVKTGQELFEDFIEVGRAVHMRTFLNIMKQYGTNTDMTLRLLNMEISKFMMAEVEDNEK